MNIKFPLIAGIKIMTTMLLVCLVIFTFSCENMNSMHEQYLKRGESLYIGAADSIRVYSGNQKIKFEWKIRADPRITQTVIYWNKRESNMIVPVKRTSEGEMWMEALLENVPEAEYVFEFVIQDDNGNLSKSIEVSGIVLGNLYVENLRNRGVKAIAKLETSDMQITWETVNITTLQYSIVEYVNTDGQQITVTVPNNETSTLLPGLETGDNIEIYTVHLPEKGLEAFQSLKRKYAMPKFEREMSKARFAPAFKPGDNTTPLPGGGEQDYLKPITDMGQRTLIKIWDGALEMVVRTVRYYIRMTSRVMLAPDSNFHTNLLSISVH